MKQFTQLKVLVFSTLFFANFSAFAMESKSKWEEMITKWINEENNKSMIPCSRDSIEKVEQYKNLMCKVFGKSEGSFGDGTDFIRYMIYEYVNLCHKKDFEYAEKFHVPGQVLLVLIDNVFKNKKNLVNKVHTYFSVNNKNGTPLTYVAHFPNAIRYCKPLPPASYRFCYYNFKTRLLRNMRCNNIVSLLKDCGADFDAKDEEGMTAKNIALDCTGYYDEAFCKGSEYRIHKAFVENFIKLFEKPTR